MRACARVGVRVIVPDPAFASFVGLDPLPARHGLTIGEVAAYLNATYALGCDLTVVPMRGWRRAMLWDQAAPHGPRDHRERPPGRFAWRRPPYEFKRRRLPIDILLGTRRIRGAVETRQPLAQIERSWLPDLARWRKSRRPFLADR